MDEKPKREACTGQSRTGVRASVSAAGLTRFEDNEGIVTLGWIAPDVFYAHYCGALTVEVGQACAAYQRAALNGVPAFHFFADSSEMKQYDLTARSALVRLLLEHRSRFASLVMLSWPGGSSGATVALATAIGKACHLLTDRAAFEGKLLLVAPGAAGELAYRGRPE